MDLTRLIYRSRNTIHAAGPRALVHFRDIVATSRERNRLLGVSGFLLFDRAQFYQVIEGPPLAVESIWIGIQRDRRHREITLLDRVTVRERLFAEWSMASFMSTGEPHPLLAKYGIERLSDGTMDAITFLRLALDLTALAETTGDAVDAAP